MEEDSADARWTVRKDGVFGRTPVARDANSLGAPANNEGSHGARAHHICGIWGHGGSRMARQTGSACCLTSFRGQQQDRARGQVRLRDDDDVLARKGPAEDVRSRGEEFAREKLVKHGAHICAWMEMCWHCWPVTHGDVVRRV